MGLSSFIFWWWASPNIASAAVIKNQEKWRDGIIRAKFYKSLSGGRHYSDRLCSDRHYSDNLQSGRPSTSLARLAYVEIGLVEIWHKLEWVEALDASKARHWSRHWGDWGERSLGRVSQWVWGPPPPEKLQRTSNTIVLPLIFGIWFVVFPISTSRRPIQLQSATQRPDCAWTVGIASVGTESVGIVWCTGGLDGQTELV